MRILPKRFTFYDNISTFHGHLTEGKGKQHAHKFKANSSKSPNKLNSTAISSSPPNYWLYRKSTSKKYFEGLLGS